MGYASEKEQIEKSSVFPEYFKQWIFEKLHLPMDKMESRNSRYLGFGYDACFYYDGIWVYTSDNALMLDMSGKGCRTCEDMNKSFDWYIFIHQFDKMIRFSNSAGDSAPGGGGSGAGQDALGHHSRCVGTK